MTDALSDLLDDDEDEQPEPKRETGKDNAAFAQMRKDLKAAQKELEEARAFRVEREKADRETAITGVFSEVGLNPKHAKLFAIANPEGEATPELVAQFAAEYGLATNAGEAVEAPAPTERGFTPTVINEGQALGSKVYTHDEFAELMKTDQNRAFKAYQDGRVKLDKIEGLSFRPE